MDLTTPLITQGTLGIGVVALSYVCIKLYNKIEQQQSRIEELQELRLSDSKEVSKDVTDVLQSNSESMRILSAKIEVVRGAKNESAFQKR